MKTAILTIVTVLALTAAAAAEQQCWQRQDGTWSCQYNQPTNSAGRCRYCYSGD